MIILNDVSKDCLQPDKRIKNKKWMADHILELMEEYRKVKNNKFQCNQIHSQIRREIR